MWQAYTNTKLGSCLLYCAFLNIQLHNMHTTISKYLFYYPVTLLKGERVLKYLSQYEKFQYLSRDVIEARQFKYFKLLLKYAVEKSPYYKKIFKENDINLNEIKSLEHINYLPYLTKELLVDYRQEIETVKKGIFISRKTTGGSTGQAVTLLKNPDALARERAATARSYEWAGVGIGDAQARFWGTPLYQKDRVKSKIVDFIANRRRYSAFAFDNETMQKYYRDISIFCPKYLYGYASFIKDFSLFVLNSGLRLPSSVKAVITTSEVLTQYMREIIESSLGVRVFNEYGCGEVGSIAHECEFGSLHVMEENLIVEVDNKGRTDGVGEIVVTDLFNYATPLIRYRIGDFATIKKERCECGRELISFENIHGRAYDCIVSPNGKVFHPELIMYIFEDIKDRLGGIKQFQVIQKSLDKILIKLVLSGSFTEEMKELIKNQLIEKIESEIDINFEFVDSISREKSGKIRLVKSEINSC